MKLIGIILLIIGGLTVGLGGFVLLLSTKIFGCYGDGCMYGGVAGFLYLIIGIFPLLVGLLLYLIWKRKVR